MLMLFAFVIFILHYSRDYIITYVKYIFVVVMHTYSYMNTEQV